MKPSQRIMQSVGKNDGVFSFVQQMIDIIDEQAVKIAGLEKRIHAIETGGHDE